MRSHVRTLAIAVVLVATSVRAQETARSPISIGNYPNVNGLRINFRDRDLGRVNGVNITVWSPYDPASGTVKGLALGVLATGANDITGLGVGTLGVGADHDIRGIALGLAGAGAGRDVRGLAIGGVGVGAGGDVRGILIGGVGVGAGGKAKGLLVGGIGAGAGGDVTGIAIGGIGVGAGGSLTGFGLGVIGVGAGGDVTGIAIGGIGVGAGGRLRGLAIGGIGVGAGEMIKGVGLGVVGVGAPKLVGGFVALSVGAENARGVVISPAYFKIARGGTFTGGALASVSDIRGTQRGLTIGLVNYARRLNGVQIGLINIIANDSSHPFLPILNWGSR